MGTKKNAILDRIREGDRVGKEAVATGEKIEGDGREIKSIMDSIDTSMDEDDVSAFDSAEKGYGRDTSAAFIEQVEPKSQQMESTETEAVNESTHERAKVSDAAAKFERAAGVTDIGRQNAERAGDSMKRSETEYGERINEAQNVIETIKTQVDEKRRSVDSIFR